MSRRKKRIGGRFIMLPYHLLNSDAWRALKPAPRSLFIELLKRYNGSNNGSIALGCREASSELKISPDTASRAFQTLSDHGFVRTATPSGFNTHGRRATEWLITEFLDDRNGHSATKEYFNWVGKNEIPSPSYRTLSPSGRTQTRNLTKETALRPITGTQPAVSENFASDDDDTYIYAMGEAR